MSLPSYRRITSRRQLTFLSTKNIITAFSADAKRSHDNSTCYWTVFLFVLHPWLHLDFAYEGCRHFKGIVRSSNQIRIEGFRKIFHRMLVSLSLHRVSTEFSAESQTLCQLFCSEYEQSNNPKIAFTHASARKRNDSLC